MYCIASSASLAASLHPHILRRERCARSSISQQKGAFAAPANSDPYKVHRKRWKMTHTHFQLFQLFNRFSPVQLSPHSTRCREPCPCCWGHLLLEGEFWNKESYSWNSRLTFHFTINLNFIGCFNFYIKILMNTQSLEKWRSVLEDMHSNWRQIV